jgi:hypothetical protein
MRLATRCAGKRHLGAFSGDARRWRVLCCRLRQLQARERVRAVMPVVYIVSEMMPPSTNVRPCSRQTVTHDPQQRGRLPETRRRYMKLSLLFPDSMLSLAVLSPPLRATIRVTLQCSSTAGEDGADAAAEACCSRAAACRCVRRWRHKREEWAQKPSVIGSAANIGCSHPARYARYVCRYVAR